MTTSTILIVSLITLIISCKDNTKWQNVNDINFTDTLYETHFSLTNNGDTVFQYDTIYFAPTDLSIDTSGFFYEASAIPTSKNKSYKIYFNRKKVVSFCDSILKTFPLNPNNELDDYFNDRLIYQALREEASKNKLNEAIFVDELPILLDRFRPLILNSTTGDKPKYIIIKHEDMGSYEIKTYNIKSKFGDTILLAATTLRPIEIENIEQK